MSWSWKFSFLFFAMLATPSAGRDSFRAVPSSGHVEREKLKADLVAGISESLSTLGTSGLDIAVIGKLLNDTFMSLPKDKDGNLATSTMRYLANSFFTKEFAWHLRGLSPDQMVHLPEYPTIKQGHHTVDSTFPSTRDAVPRFLLLHWGRWFNHGKGGNTTETLGLSSASSIVAVLSNLIYHEGITKLETAYTLNGLDIFRDIPEHELEAVIDSFMVMLALGRDGIPSKTQHEQDRANLHRRWSAFSQLETFTNDLVRNMVWSSASASYQNPFRESLYSFDIASDIAVTVSRQYGKVRDLQCQDLKDGLVAMDTRHHGRVPLKSFYSKKAIGHWTLNESPQYLRELGVLDETVQELGPQLIIPNYVTAVSNCDSPSGYYSVCCIHECESILNSFQAKVGQPSTKPETILNLVVNMSSSSQEAPQNLSATIVQALQDVAAAHNGEVFLHSRLFAEWLHYVFPHECSYPHVSGTYHPMTPTEWTAKYGTSPVATEQEVAQQMKFQSKELSHDVNMSQWTLDDELLTSWPGESWPEATAQSDDSDFLLNYASTLQIAIYAVPPSIFFLRLVVPFIYNANCISQKDAKVEEDNL